MKTNLKYYTHRTDSHRHPKLIMLVKSYNTAVEGLAAEARFWRIINLISESENCVLDLTERRNKAYVAQVLEMNLGELNTFIDLLKSEDIALITELDEGKFTAKKVQEQLDFTMKERNRAATFFDKKKGKNVENDILRVKNENLRVENENLRVENIHTILYDTIQYNTTTTTTTNSSIVGSEISEPHSGGGGKNLNEEISTPDTKPSDSLSGFIANSYQRFFERKPKQTSEVDPLIQAAGQFSNLNGRIPKIIEESFIIAVQQGNTKTSYLIGIFKKLAKGYADELKKTEQQAAKQVMRQVEQITQLHEESSKEQERAAEVRKLTDFFEQHASLFTGEQTATIRQAIAKDSFFKLQSVILPVMERFNSGEVVEDVKVEEFDDDMPF